MNTVLHIITGLDLGGAELALFRLIVAPELQEFRHVVVSLGGHGSIVQELKGRGVVVHELGVSPTLLGFVRAVHSVVRQLRSLRPKVVHSWMYHANIVSLCACVFARPVAPLLWAIRHGLHDSESDKKLTKVLIRIGALASHIPTHVLYVSERGRKMHQDIGYNRTQAIVIANPCDTQRYAPNAQFRAQLRTRLKIADDGLIIGHISRYHPVKNIGGLVRAFSAVRQRVPHAHLVLVGTGLESSNTALCKLLRQCEMADTVHLLGASSEPWTIAPGFDVGVLASKSEAFPSVVCEMMACGVPCVVTDVGDCSMIVDDTGFVVAVDDDQALAQALVSVLGLSTSARQALGMRARARIEERFTPSTIYGQYQALYQRLVGRSPS